jgi:DNA-binding CsgD family transcriptional regulator
MADRRLSILVALADAGRAEDISATLAEEGGFVVSLASGIEADDHAGEHYDAVLATAAIDAVTPHVVLGDSPGGGPSANIRAVLPAATGDSVIAAALRLAAMGFRIVPTEPVLAPVYGNGELALAPRLPAAAVALTQREQQVLALLAEGAPNKLIARRLDISVHTAKFHVAALLQKLGAVNRTDAIAIAMREGLVLV